MPGLYDDDDEYGEQSGPKALREALAKEKKAREDLESKLAKLSETNESLAKQLKTTTLRDALSDAKVDPKFARLAERDGVEATAEAVKKWVDENKDIYAFTPPAAPAADPLVEDQDVQPEDQLDDNLVAQILAARGVESSGQPSKPSTTATKVAELKPNQFATYEDLQQALLESGVVFNPE